MVLFDFVHTDKSLRRRRHLCGLLLPVRCTSHTEEWSYPDEDDGVVVALALDVVVVDAELKLEDVVVVVDEEEVEKD